MYLIKCDYIEKVMKLWVCISMTDSYTAHPVQRDMPLTSGSLLCVHVFHVFYVIWIIDCMCKWQELCTHIIHRRMACWAKLDLLTYQHMRMMDTHVGPDSWHSCSADNSWASLCMDLPILPEEWSTGFATRRYLAFTLWHVCVFQMVSDTHRGWFIFTVYICAVQVMVSDACWIIEIHCVRGAVAADLSIGTWDRERQGQSRDLAVVSVISYLERKTLGTPLQ